ncbi:MAG: YraN family protein [Actinomycetota bacterium]|nr:YraN family protein [Actinomycetota bacterium]
MDTATSPLPARSTLARYGERLAERYLRERGFTVLARNWRCRVGEVDIVALDGDCLVVCEVKTRRTTAFGSPVEAVTVTKLVRLRRLAATWLAEHDTHVGDVRIDVIGILRPRRGVCTIEHLVGVGA